MEQAQRRLAAILAADVVGYSRMMEVDETGTLAALKQRRRDILEPLVSKYQGRIFKVTGDGVLVEFGSAVNAVQCAVDLQRDMARANNDQAVDRHIVLRVGINLGDIIVEGNDLYGDGVNIAARLEALAEPGGILISGTAYDHAQNKVRIGFEDVGVQALKNITQPIRAYLVNPHGDDVAVSRKKDTDRPSIAVLPFTNMSGEPEQEYFSDGISEDIITELSKFRELVVIARNSSFRYRQAAVDIKRVGRELGVRYLLEGSVRKAGDHVRITAQLIEVATEAHLWADRYDRRLQDIFAVQDEVTRTIVNNLAWRIASTGAEQARRKQPQSWAAYECYLQGREYALIKYDILAAMPLLEKAIKLDPGFAPAYAVRAFIGPLLLFDDGYQNHLDTALSYAQKALALDDTDAFCHLAMGFVCTFLRRFDLAGTHLVRARLLNPNDVKTMFIHAHWLARVDRVQEALEELDRVLVVDPFVPDIYWEARSIALFPTGRYGEVIQAVNRMSKIEAWNQYFLVAAHAHLGHAEQARFHANEVRRLKPDYTERWVTDQEPYQNPKHLERLLDGLRKAGLSE